MWFSWEEENEKQVQSTWKMGTMNYAIELVFGLTGFTGQNWTCELLIWNAVAAIKEVKSKQVRKRKKKKN